MFLTHPGEANRPLPPHLPPGSCALMRKPTPSHKSATSNPRGPAPNARFSLGSLSCALQGTLQPSLSLPGVRVGVGGVGLSRRAEDTQMPPPSRPPTLRLSADDLDSRFTEHARAFRWDPSAFHPSQPSCSTPASLPPPPPRWLLLPPPGPHSVQQPSVLRPNLFLSVE